MYFFSFARVTVLLLREPRPCLSETKKNVFSIFFPSTRVTVLLPREVRLWFRERHGRASFGKGKNRALGSVFSPSFRPGFFMKKKVHQNLSTWELFLNISTRGIQWWKRFEIWTHGLKDKTYWINLSMKKGKTPKLRQVARCLDATCRDLWKWSALCNEYSLISDFDNIVFLVKFQQTKKKSPFTWSATQPTTE